MLLVFFGFTWICSVDNHLHIDTIRKLNAKNFSFMAQQFGTYVPICEPDFEKIISQKQCHCQWNTLIKPCMNFKRKMCVNKNMLLIVTKKTERSVMQFMRAGAYVKQLNFRHIYIHNMCQCQTVQEQKRRIKTQKIVARVSNG